MEQRRRRGPERPTCIREGCPRVRAKNHLTCSVLCTIVSDKLSQAEELCRLLGPGPRSSALWAAVTTLNDAVSELYRETRRAEGVRDA